jgi:hypothetical protein
MFDGVREGVQVDRATAMATLPPLYGTSLEHIVNERIRWTFEGLHGMAEEGNLRERMRPEEVEDVCEPLPRSSSVLRGETSRGCGGPKTQRTEQLTSNEGRPLDRSTRDAHEGVDRLAGGHGGTPWIAIANSVSSHCRTVSRTQSAKTQEARNDTHNSPWRMTSGRSVFELCLGRRASYAEVNGTCASSRNILR